VRRRPPRAWDELTWEEKMAVWRRHRLIDALLGLATVTALVVSAGVAMAVRSGRLELRAEAWTVVAALVVIGTSIALTYRLMNYGLFRERGHDD